MFFLCRLEQRLNGELPLSESELESVFDCLDSDGNGFLTLEEFSSGFSRPPLSCECRLSP